MIRVGVVDDQPLLVAAFRALVDAQPDLTVTGVGATGQDAIVLAQAGEVDVMLLDIRMPGIDGVAATGRITALPDPPRVLILTTFNVDDLVVGALAAGARGFLLKDVEPTVLLDAIRRVHRGEGVIDPQSVPHVLQAFDHPEHPVGPPVRVPGAEDLTAREREVLDLIARGATNQEIAASLFIGETTVKTHVSSLLMKLQARDRVALVLLGLTLGLGG